MTDNLKNIKPYGTWVSPISAKDVAGKTLRFGVTQASNHYVYWTECRPYEAGRCVIMRSSPSGELEDVLPSPYSARSQVHEYGGGEFIVNQESIYFINAKDQDIYFMEIGEKPVRITEKEHMRFSDLALCKDKTLIAVTEQYTPQSPSHHPKNYLSRISKKKKTGSNIEIIHSEHDFYAYPRISPDGKTIAWIAWDLPDMPWDSACLYIAEISTDGMITNVRQIAGGNNSAVFQPEWSEDNILYFIWDKNGWGNIYCFDRSNITPVQSSKKEYGRPLWGLGTRCYTINKSNNTLIASCYNEGKQEIHMINPSSGDLKAIDTPFRSFDSLVSSGGDTYGIATTDTSPAAIIRLEDGYQYKVIRPCTEVKFPAEEISVGRILNVQSDSKENLYGLYYPPTNAVYQGPNGQLPPLITMIHGGPTGSADRGFKFKIQYWTSRGFAVFDLDYSGSTGYGREYKERLDGNWGIRDVEDVKTAADYLIKNKLAAPNSLLISGGSAGGFTVLLALAELNMFTAGACYYGVADLLHLQTCTHKFEGGYLFRLLGVAPPKQDEPLDKSIFIERSPITKAHKITEPVIFFQGLDDKIVPPGQTRAMVATLKNQGQMVYSMEFEGEGHGFRKSETIQDVLNYEYIFYAKQLGLDLSHHKGLSELKFDH